MTDQPKPMSVDEARMALYNSSEKNRHEAEETLIAAVRADERAKCAHEKTEALVSLQQCNNRAAEFVRWQERARVLAEFRKLADDWKSYPKDIVELKKVSRELSRLIQSLETPNQKP